VRKDLLDPGQVALFLAVGAFVYVIYVGLFRLAGLWFPELVALSIAFVIAVSIHFALNNWLVFPNPETSSEVTVAKVGRFLVVVTVNYLLSVSISIFLLQWWVPDYIALGMATIATTITNFAMNRLWVFA
jgi:putative flippase GtrA